MRPLALEDIKNLHEYELERPAFRQRVIEAIEVTEYEKIQPTLDQFVGLDEPGRLALVVGPRRYPAVFAGGQSRENRMSAVHYVRFRVGRGRQLLASRETAALEVDHAGYRARQTLPPETVEELLRDLSD